MSTPLLTVRYSESLFCTKRGKRSQAIASGLLGGLVGAFAAHTGFEAATPLMEEILRRDDAQWLILPGFPLMMLFAILWDELGHRVAARLVGLPFRLRFRWDGELPDYANPSASKVTDTRGLPRRFALMFAGGPVANLLLSVALLLAASLPAVATNPVIHLALILLAVASALVCVVSTLPTPSAIGLTDGGNVARLMRGGLAAERDVHLFRLAMQVSTGTAPRDWDSKVVNGALQPYDGSVFEWQARQLAYRHALERGDIDAAGEHLDIAMDMISLIPKAAQAAARLEAAYFEAWHRGRAEFAMEWLEGVPVKFDRLPRYEHLRATAAIQSALGERDVARSAVAEAIRQIVMEKNVPAWGRCRLTEMGVALNR